jgi:tetratricopeptide (TPR) repeat protein
MKNGQRVIAPDAAEFFAHILRDTGLREADDFCYLAQLHEWMEEYEEAYAALSKGESLYPDHWKFALNRAAFRARAGDYSAALPNAERATQLAPWKAQSWRLLAMILEDIGRPSEAESANTRAEEVQRIRDELAAEIKNV